MQQAHNTCPNYNKTPRPKRPVLIQICFLIEFTSGLQQKFTEIISVAVEVRVRQGRDGSRSAALLSSVNLNHL